MRTPAPAAGLLLAAVLSVASIAGCGTTPVQLTATTSVHSRPVTEPELDLLHQAEQLLIRDCMRRAGFNFWPVPRRPVAEYRDFPYVLDDPAWAARHGYGTELRRKLDRVARSNPNQSYFRRLSPDRQNKAVDAIHGTGPGSLTARLPNGITVSHSDQGCTSEAQRSLYGDLPAWYRGLKLSENLVGERVGAALRDPRFTAAIAPWSRCLKARGMAYATPQDTRSAFGDPARLPPRRTEVALAVAEATCARSTSLAATAAALDREYGERLRRRFPTELAEHRRLQLAALPRARAVVARG